jgi:gas vesicle protein
MSTTKKILAAAAAGAAVGAVLGILFAPAKGSETRKKMTDKGKDLSEGLKESIHRMGEKLSCMKENIESKANGKKSEFV